MSAMSYIVERTEYGRTEYEVQIARFASDLAAALVGSAFPRQEGMPQDSWVITLTGNTELHIYADRYMRRREKVRVHVSIHATDVKHDERCFGDKTARTCDASINPDGRTIEAIARDITRRVIKASEPALAAQRKYAAELRANRASIVRHANNLKNHFPALDIRVNETEQRAELYHSEPYISGTMYADGTVSIRHMVTLRGEQFRKLVALLTEGRDTEDDDADYDDNGNLRAGVNHEAA